MKTGRNQPCTCGSGKKYKHCCEGKAAERQTALTRAIVVAVAVLIALVVAVTFVEMRSSGADADNGRVWSPEHGHYHDADGRG